MLSVVLLNVIMLSVVMHSVVAPFIHILLESSSSGLDENK
jgi:hypothetical protein